MQVDLEAMRSSLGDMVEYFERDLSVSLDQMSVMDVSSR